MSAYVKVWLGLLLLTAVEVALAYLRTPLAVMILLLLALSFAKAGAIAAWFMHLKDEPRALSLALFPAFLFAVCALLGILPDGGRALEMLSR
jgi:caa(3)-type oxidase subunit IV